jgi:hypothetical protein
MVVGCSCVEGTKTAISSLPEHIDVNVAEESSAHE